jgi:hypothetical protein
MVKNRKLLVATFFALACMLFVSTVSAWSGTYHINREYVKIWINQNGSIDLFYNVTLTLDSGDEINYVYIGQPNRYFTIGEAKDQNGLVLKASDASSGTDYKVSVKLNSPLRAGKTIWFTLLTNVAHMIYDDTYNPGNVGMQFIPTWWTSATVTDLRILIVLPPNVTKDIVKTSVNWTNTLTDEGRLAIYWQKQNLSPSEQFPVDVSFPKKYVQTYDTSPPDGQPSPVVTPYSFMPYVVMALFLGGIALVVGIFIFAAGKKLYFAPKMSIETLGIRHGLTAVEASYLLDMQPTRIVTEILYSLLQKRAVWVEAAKPSIKLRIIPQFQDKVGTEETALRYYEIDFLDAIEPDGMLNEEKLAKTVMLIMKTVEEKMRGYCRRDTIYYYQKVVEKAWQQVEQAGTPDLASKTYDEQLLWLLLDPECQKRTEFAFHARAFEPSPFWLWYWYGYHHYHPHPTYTPNVETPAQAVKPPTIPGADFANNIATAVENTSNNIVANLEKFANAIIPIAPSQRASNEPVHKGASCVCACHACACVCACVSCACACASGGVG